MKGLDSMHSTSNPRPATSQPRPTTTTATAQLDRNSKTEQIHTALFSHYRR